LTGASLEGRRTPVGSNKSTREQILDVAERLVQTRGFNGFSYADVSVELAITKASLHYHFPGKADLGLALIERYTAAFERALAAMDASDDTMAARFERYVALYVNVLEDGRLCLCGMLAAEYQTLPETMQAALRRFFEVNDAWLARHLEAGRRSRGGRGAHALLGTRGRHAHHTPIRGRASVLRDGRSVVRVDDGPASGLAPVSPQARSGPRRDSRAVGQFPKRLNGP
jgi:TetR/AcrR family transcriptional repressor of nem operon